MNPIDKELERLGESLKELSIPDQLKRSVKLGIERGKRDRRHQLFKKSFRPVLAAALLLLVFSFGIRVSTAFADTVSHIPGLAPFVEFIRGDQSIEDALNNHYGTPLNQSETKGTTTVTLKQMVADEHRMVLFYTIRSSTLKKGSPIEPTLQDSHGHALGVSYEYDYYDPDNQTVSINYQKIDITFPEEISDKLTNPLILKLKVDAQTYSFQIPFDLKKIDAAKKVYKLNHTVSIGNQKMTFNKVTIYPTGAAIDVSYNSNNTKQLTNLEDLRLVDEKGRSYATIKNGASGLGSPDDGHQVLFLDSSYFSKPKTLHLKLTTVRAIDKSEQDVVVNLKTKELIKAPADHLLTLQDVEKGSAVFKLKRTKEDKPFRDYQIFDSYFADASGKKFIINSTGVSDDAYHAPKTEKIELSFPEKQFKEPVTFHIIDYPTRLHGNVDIKIK